MAGAAFLPRGHRVWSKRRSRFTLAARLPEEALRSYSRSRSGTLTVSG